MTHWVLFFFSPNIYSFSSPTSINESIEGIEPTNHDVCNLSEWNANPVLITVETTDYPIENIIFPTVTVCSDDGGVNTFEFVAKMFDYVKFPCFDDK